MSEELLSTGKVARRLGVCSATVRKWAKECALPHYNITGIQGRAGKFAFRWSEVEEWLKDKRTRLLKP